MLLYEIVGDRKLCCICVIDPQKLVLMHKTLGERTKVSSTARSFDFVNNPPSLSLF